MSKIQRLSPAIVAQIAAGEVIEKPIYAIKELIDNSLDADASIIEIELLNGGYDQIKVIDNGVGMDQADLELSFQIHTTSKLPQQDNLSSIQSFGFRGEALSSIAAVSRLQISTRQPDSPKGYIATIDNNQLIQLKPIGMAPGTIVTVHQIFAKLPGRKSQIRTKPSDIKDISQMIIHYATIWPSIHFRLTHNQKLILDLSPVRKTNDRLSQLLGADIANQLIPFEANNDYFRLSGYISPPQIHTTKPIHQLVYINQRLVEDKIINQIVKKAYGRMLTPQTWPIFILFLALPFERVDVNIHPRKTEVRLLEPDLIYSQIEQIITKTLSDNNLNWQANHQLLPNISPRFGNTQTETSWLLKDQDLSWTLHQPTTIQTDRIQQIDKLYLVTSTNKGLIIIDQHAAHERVLYYQLQQQFKDQLLLSESYQLAKPYSISLSITEQQHLTNINQQLNRLGFEIEHFRGQDYLINKVPRIFHQHQLNDLVHQLLTIEISTELDLQTEKLITYLACRGAVKAGDSLTIEQRQELIDQLEQTPDNATCPHGRPTKIEITTHQLAKAFKR